MLRVYSILYLQQVWKRPAEEEDKFVVIPTAVVEQEEEESNNTTVNYNKAIIATNNEVNEVEEESCYGTVNIVSSSSTSRQSTNNDDNNTTITSEEYLAGAEEHGKGNKEDVLLATLDEASSYSNSSIYTLNGKASSLISFPVLPPSSRSETPSTQHQAEIFSSSHNNSVLLLNENNDNNKITIEREYYEDDISSDTDEAEEEEENVFTTNTNQYQLPLTPPPTPKSKFSPKRMLHRAKSSINDESVKKIGRRTSLFLEKFNQLHQQQNQQQQQQQSSVSQLPPINLTPQNTKNGNIKEDLAKGLRRQSSRLTVKGKTLTKKIKRVLSFHQSATVATATT